MTSTAARQVARGGGGPPQPPFARNKPVDYQVSVCDAPLCYTLLSSTEFSLHTRRCMRYVRGQESRVRQGGAHVVAMRRQATGDLCRGRAMSLCVVLCLQRFHRFVRVLCCCSHKIQNTTKVRQFLHTHVIIRELVAVLYRRAVSTSSPIPGTEQQPFGRSPALQG